MLANAAYVFALDCIRYLKWSDVLGEKHLATIESKALFLAHSLEKGIAMPDAGKTRQYGGPKALRLLGYCKRIRAIEPDSRALPVALDVLGAYLQEPMREEGPAQKIAAELSGFQGAQGHSSKITVTRDEAESWSRLDLDAFFLNRHSVRFFSDEPLDEKVLNNALKLARRTPSVCNRQGWKVVNFASDASREAALDFQTGSREFRKHVHHLLLVVCDFRVFHGARERNQGWIDGGMFGMSLIYAFRRLGISSVSLNANMSAKELSGFREKLNIPDYYGPIMFIAYGKIARDTEVPASHRKPISDLIETR